MAKKEESPLKEGDRLGSHVAIESSPLLDSITYEPLIKLFEENVKRVHRKYSNVYPKTWYGIEKALKPYVAAVRKTRREVERKYQVKLPAGCLLITWRRLEPNESPHHKAPAIAEVDERQVRLFKRG